MEKRKPTYEELERRCRELEALNARAAQKQEHEHYLATILETTHDGFIAINAKRMLTDANEAYCRMSGYTREELLKLSIHDIDADETSDDTAARFTRILETGRETFETRHRRKDGTVFTVEVSASYYPEKLPRLICFCRDVTERQQAEEKLHFLVRMLDEAPDSITVHNTDGRFLYANRKTFALHGYDENEFMAINLHDLDMPESEAMIMERFRQIEENGEATFEVAHYRRDGSSLPLSVHTKSIEWQGKPAVLSIATDITERKKAEKALSRSEERFRLFADLAPVWIVISDKNEKTLYVSPAFVHMFGYTIDYMPSVNEWWPLAYPEKEMRDKIRREWHSLMSAVRESNAAVNPVEYPVTCKDGSLRYIEFRISASAELNIIIFSDITERKKAENALRESEEKYRTLVDNAEEGILVAQDGMLKFVNRYLVGMLEGYTEQDLTSLPFSTFIHPGDRGMVVGYHTRRLEGEPVIPRYIFRAVTRDGVTKWIENSAVLIEWNGKPASLNFLVDITERKKTEDALRESEQRFRSFIENVNDIVYTLSPDGIFTYISPNWLDFVGKPADEAIGTSFERYVHPDDVRLCRAFLGKVLTTGEKQSTVEYRVKHADGSWRWHVSNGAPLRDADGSVTSYIGIARDVTDRKQAAMELHKQSESMEASIDGMAILHQNEIYTYVNTSHAEVYGYREPGELLGKSWRILYDSDELDRFEHEIMPEFRRNGKWSGEAAGKKKDGTLFPQDISLTALQGGGLICLVRDATKRKHAEMELERQKNLLQKIFDVLPVGLWFTDKNGKLLSGNAKGIKIWGAEPLVDPSEYGIFKARRLPSGEEIAPEDWALAHTIREGVTIVDELLEIDALDGKKRVILNSTAPVLDEQGEIQGAIVVNQDITDYQKLQEQLVQSQKMESVGRLAGGVAHDFNNMLAVVLGNVQFAMEQTDPSLPLHGDLREIEKAAERSVTLTRQLLAFARKQTVEPKILDLNEKVTGMINMLKRLIGEDIDLIWKPAKTLPHIYIDPSQIDQILANLCVNARDAIKDVGTVIIESGSVVFDDEYCAEHEGFTPGEYVMLSVSDDGSGMDKNILSNIFDPFFTTKEQGKGTGLGLATVYGIVKQNNGFINVYSEKGHGTTFTLYLPRYFNESQKFESQTPPKKVYTGSETILLVEDEPQLLELSRKFLDKLGYEAITASSPAEAVRIAGDYPGRIHLLITDIVMPEMNGRDLAKQLRASHPDMKFLFMSGYTADVIAHHGVLEDGVQFIQKPFSLHDFSVKIKEALKEE